MEKGLIVLVFAMSFVLLPLSYAYELKTSNTDPLEPIVSAILEIQNKVTGFVITNPTSNNLKTSDAVTKTIQEAQTKVYESIQSLEISDSHTYVYFGNSIVEKINTTNEVYFHSDHLGSTRLITDSNGNKVSENSYTPFGIDQISSNNKFKFTGKEEDSSNLYYYGARYYDPEFGRFTQIDPIYNPLQTPYAYANDNPIKFVDPDGRDEEPAIVLFRGASESHFRQNGRVGAWWTVDLSEALEKAYRYEDGIVHISMLSKSEFVELIDSGDMEVRDVRSAVWHFLLEKDDPPNIRTLSIEEANKAIDDVLARKGMKSLSRVDLDEFKQFMKGTQEFFNEGEGKTFGKVAKTTGKGISKGLKMLPIVGTCVGLFCAADEARSGDWTRAGIDAAGAFFDPIDWGTIGYDLIKSTPKEGLKPQPGYSSNPHETKQK